MTASSPLILTFYGDDFTGKTDAMEALALAGLRTVLFFALPAPELLEHRFPDLRCMGIAGTSRAMSPAGMDHELEPILREPGRRSACPAARSAPVRRGVKSVLGALGLGHRAVGN